MTEETERSRLPNGVQAPGRLNQDDALVPDLELVERMIGESLQRAA